MKGVLIKMEHGGPSQLTQCMQKSLNNSAGKLGHARGPEVMIQMLNLLTVNAYAQ